MHKTVHRIVMTLYFCGLLSNKVDETGPMKGSEKRAPLFRNFH